MTHKLLRLRRALLPLIACAASAASGATLEVRPAPERCGAVAAATATAPAAAATRIPDSQAVRGSRNIAWAWLGSPTSRYSHAALGSTVHGGSLHVLVAQPDGSQRALSLELPADRVFEDRAPRLADLDGDGRDEIILVESDAKLGASLVVYGLRLGAGARQPVLAVLARGPFLGAAQRWLNPVGVADFDGDGRLDIAAVTTPHIGGVLTLYRYQPPALEPLAQLPAFSNHRFGTAEQQLSAVAGTHAQRPAVIVPGGSLRTLRVLRLDGAGRWKDQAAPVALTAEVKRVTALPAGACVLMTNGKTVQATLRE
jgi:hypothetical protein